MASNIDIILASGSPRRKQLLSSLGVDFKAISPNTDEIYDENFAPCEIVKYISKQKAKEVEKTHISSAIIAADTIVVLNGEILEKPIDKKNAKDMLHKLSGNWHEVFTGVCILTGGKTIQFYERTRVHFVKLDEKLISWYISTKEPMDKAGAYGIQGYGAILVDKIEGDFYNVMGFPISKIMREFKKLEIYDIGRG